MELFEEAVREQIRLRAAIDGPTGAGKTFTALQWARIIAGPDGPVALVDTESESAKRYAAAPGEVVDRMNYWDPPYRFGCRGFDPPHDPRELAKLLAAAGPALGREGVLIVDSLSHFWESEGGTLDIVDDAGNGNRFAGWKEGTPAQRYLLDAMLRCRCHLIVCMRSKMEYVLEQTVNKQGRSVEKPTRVGMAPVQRPGIEYEFDVVASMEQRDHVLTISKSRIHEVADRVAHKGRSHEVAETLRAWLDTGARLVTDAQAEGLIDLFNSIGDEVKRRDIKQSFVAVYGTPFKLREDKLAEATDWIRSTAGLPSAETAKPEAPLAAPQSPVEAPETAATAPAGGSGRKGRGKPETPTPGDLPEDQLASMGAAFDQITGDDGR